MSTNCYLYAPAEHDEAGNVTMWKTIYVHSDGYLTGVGRVLMEHFMDPEKVEMLFALGDVSALYPRIAGAPGHSFATPVKDQTVFYGRDRGEEGTAAEMVYVHEMPGRFCADRLVNVGVIGSSEFIWDGSNWYCYDAGFDLYPDNIATIAEVFAAISQTPVKGI